MSAPAVARSSARANLLRYRRSWGLWLLLLVAPVGARFMIGGEQGGGVQIAVHDHLPVLTPAVLGLWLGIVVSTLLLPIGYIYLRANTTRRQPWQVEEVTAASRVAIMLGRFAADAAVLLAALAALTLAGWFLGWLLVEGPVDPLAITRGLWIVAAPALIGLAALRTLLGALPWLRGPLGDFAFLILWITALSMPAVNQGQTSSFGSNLRDYMGYYRPLVGGAPDATDDFAIGGVKPKPGRIALDADKGLAAPGYIPSRLAWIGIAIGTAALAGLLYRPHRPRRRRAPSGRVARLLAAGPPRAADPAAPAARPARHPLAGLIEAEARLIGAGRLFLILAIGAAGLGILQDYRHIGSPAALLLLVFALSAHAGRSEARGLLALTRTTAWPPMIRRAAFLLAGIGWSLLLAVPAALAHVSPEPLRLALATGTVAALVAILLATLGRSAFAPRIVLLVMWYGYFSS